MRGEQQEDTSNEALRASLCHRMIEFVVGIANKNGMSHDDIENCALSFVEHMLQKTDIAQSKSLRFRTAWLYRCAENWVRNELRRQRRQLHREILSLSDAPHLFFEQDQLTNLLCQEFSDRLFLGVSLLSAASQRLFVDFYILNYSCREIADATGRSENATRQSLWALRIRLRKLLTNEGFDEVEAVDYLQIITSTELNLVR